MRWGWEKIVICLLLATLIQIPNEVESCVEEERVALLELSSYMKSQDSSSKWLENESEKHNCCSWERVVCNSATQRVMKLHLNGMVLRDIEDEYTGKIKNLPWLFNLSLFHPFAELRSLDLSFNTITGFLENDGFSKLTKLQVLDLSSNYVNGSVPELASLTELQVLNLESNLFSDALPGVCNLKNLQVLRVGQNSFHGDFPSCFQNLRALQSFDISRNNFKGKFPKMLLNFTSLRELDLSDNYFEGRLFLGSFANHSKLRNLQLSRNNLEVHTEDSAWQPTFQLQYLGLQTCGLNKPKGTIPKFLSYQHNLVDIIISNNSLVGSFPVWLLNNNPHIHDLDLTNNSFGGLLHLPSFTKPSLQILSISGNHFQGEVPEKIGYMFPNLIYLDLSTNHFEGQIPTSISRMAQLWLLDLSSNNFSGEVPSELLNHCNFLAVLKLSDNNLQGEAIPEHMNLPMLFLLKLSNNHFRGTIKDSLLRSPNLISLDIFNNEVSGSLPRWIGNLSLLNAILASKNFLEGYIPLEICNLQLTFLDLSHNNFTGTIPSCSNFSSLLYMHLHNNNLRGPIPTTLSSLSSLRALDLRDNLFSGSIPSWINKLSQLRVLLLAGNNLYSQVPHQICQLTNVNILDLSRNSLFGGIPTCFWNMSFGERVVDPYGYRLFSYEFDIETNHYLVQEVVNFLAKNQYLSYAGSNHQLMSGLDLSRNNFSGVIPPEFGNLTQMHSINLSHNCLSGSIPSSFSNVKQLESLDLSYNKLSGNVPPQLVELTFLAVFNVSYNDMSGRTPETGQFANFDESSYLGNPGLCRSLLNKSCHPNASHPPSMTNKLGGHGAPYMEDFFWSFAVSSVIALIATLSVLYINPQWRGAWFDLVEKHVLWWLPLK